MKNVRFSLLAILLTMLVGGNLAVAQQNIVNTAVGAGNFKTLVAAVQAAGLADTLATGEFTVFAPTDEAFSKVDPATLEFLLKPENKEALVSILTYHVVPGRVRAADAYPLRGAATVNGQRLPISLQAEIPKIGGAGVVKTDIECSNGVIHVIDSVLLPASDNIPTVATNAGTFNTLLAAVGAAGLGEALSGPGPFTVFAPSDEAFAKLPQGTVESLLKPENKQKLVDILKYHVIPSRVYAADAVKAKNASTLLGQSIRASFSEMGVSINDARVVAKDIEASNGVIHVIDSVLLPSAGMSPAETMTMLNETVARGSAVFNSGHHQQCCDIYMTTLKSIKGRGIAGGDTHTMQTIENALSTATRTHDASQRAWVLRGCIDSVYTRMSQMPMTIRN